MGIHQRLDAPVQRVDARAGIGHVVALAGCMHHGLCHLKKMLAVDDVNHLHQHADASLNGDCRPAAHGQLSRVKKRVNVRLRVSDVQCLLRVWRNFFAHLGDDAARLVQIEPAAQMRLIGLQPGGLRLGGIRVFGWQFRERAPAMPLPARRFGPLKREAMLLEQVHAEAPGVGAWRDQISRWWRATSVPGTVSDADSVSPPSGAKLMLRTCCVPTKFGLSE